MPSTLGIVASGEDVFNDAVLWLDTARSTASEATMVNYGKGGSALNAQYGSTAASSFYNGSGLVLSGVSNNYAFVPDEAALDITGDIEIVMRVALTDWTPASNMCLVAKRTTAGGLSFQLVILNTGQAVWSFNNGTDLFSNGVLTPVTSLTDGSAYWLRFRRVASSGVISLDSAEDQASEPATYTQTWTPSGTRSSGNITATSSILEIGSNRTGTGDVAVGTFYRTIVRNGIAGTAVFDANFAQPVNTSVFTASTGQVVTLVTGADTNDPLLLVHTGTNYLYTPGTPNNHASTPDAAALDITGDIELEVIFQSPPDWTVNAGGNGVLIGKEAAANRSYTLRRLLGTTSIQFVWSADGSTPSFLSATVAPPSGTNAIKVQHDVDNGSGGNTATFYTSSDYGVSYSVLGAPVVGAGTTSHFSGTAELQIGSGSVSGSLTEAAGWRRAIVRNGIDGTTVFDANFTTGITSGAQTTFTATTGQTVTINRATSGRKSVAVVRNVLLFGTDDYLQVADNDLVDFTASDSWTLVATVRQWGSIAQVSHIVSKQVAAGTGARWRLSTPTSSLAPNGVIGDGTNAASATAAAPSSGALSTFTMVVNRTTNQMTVYTDNTSGSSVSTSAVGSSANALNLRIGAPPDTVATNTYNGEVLSVAIWRRVLSTNEIATAVARYA